MGDTRTVEFKDAGHDIRLVVREATALDGMKRTVLQGRAERYIKESSLAGLAGGAAVVMARYAYPALIAATVQAEGLDIEMDIDTFLELPEQFFWIWSEAVFDLNPHWSPYETSSSQEAEKNAGSPISET